MEIGRQEGKGREQIWFLCFPQETRPFIQSPLAKQSCLLQVELIRLFIPGLVEYKKIKSPVC